jgi:hypothetical protein
MANAARRLVLSLVKVSRAWWSQVDLNLPEAIGGGIGNTLFCCQMMDVEAILSGSGLNHGTHTLGEL